MLVETGAVCVHFPQFCFFKADDFAMTSLKRLLHFFFGFLDPFTDFFSIDFPTIMHIISGVFSFRAAPVTSWCSGVPLVLEALLSGGKLNTLDLGANGLTGAGVEALLAGLGACPSLQTLEVIILV